MTENIHTAPTDELIDPDFLSWWNDMENGCPTLVIDNDEQFAIAVWNAAIKRIKTMTDQSTPGPWKADGYHVRQSGQGGTRMIADVCYTGPHHTSPDEYPKSCRIMDEANARLISAAPDMLAALRNLENDDGSFHFQSWQICQAAIAKAIYPSIQ